MGSLRSHCCALTASETTMQRHVRRCLAGFPRNDLRKLGFHLWSLLIRTIRHVAVFDRERFFDCFSCMLQQSCVVVVTFIGNGLQSASVGRDFCFFAKRENNLLEHHCWQFLTSDPRFKEYMSLQCQGNHEHVWKQTSKGKREYPVAMVR